MKIDSCFWNSFSSERNAIAGPKGPILSDVFEDVVESAVKRILAQSSSASKERYCSLCVSARPDELVSLM